MTGRQRTAVFCPEFNLELGRAITIVQLGEKRQCLLQVLRCFLIRKPSRRARGRTPIVADGFGSASGLDAMPTKTRRFAVDDCRKQRANRIDDLRVEPPTRATNQGVGRRILYERVLERVPAATRSGQDAAVDQSLQTSGQLVGREVRNGRKQLAIEVATDERADLCERPRRT